jgi:hypothetical protein
MTGRDRVLDTLAELRARLKQAEALERLHGVATVEEFGRMGTAPE